MNYQNKILFEAPYYKIVQKNTIETIEMYIKLTNWISSEFDLYLQDESSSLTIYYPNGSFNISCENQILNEIILEFSVISKSRKDCLIFFIQINEAYNHFKKI